MKADTMNETIAKPIATQVGDLHDAVNLPLEYAKTLIEAIDQFMGDSGSPNTGACDHARILINLLNEKIHEASKVLDESVDLIRAATGGANG